MVKAARDGGADVVLFTWPTVLGSEMSTAELARVVYPYYAHGLDELQALYAEYQTTVRQVAAEDHVQVIDIAAWFDGSNKADLFVDTLHFTCAGHAWRPIGLPRHSRPTSTHSADSAESRRSVAQLT
jgi:hypothetical protein